MKIKFLVFLFIFVLFLSFGFYFFIKTIKEVKEMEKESAIEIPKFEKKEVEEIKKLPLEQGKNEINFKIKNLKGREYSLKDFKGKNLFIVFWATWCRFCSMQLKEIQKIYEEFKNEEIEFLIISYESIPAIEKYVKKYGYTFPVYTQISELPPEFKISGIPATFILDKEGKIILKKEGYFNWAGLEGKEILRKII